MSGQESGLASRLQVDVRDNLKEDGEAHAPKATGTPMAGGQLHPMDAASPSPDSIGRSQHSTGADGRTPMAGGQMKPMDAFPSPESGGAAYKYETSKDGRTPKAGAQLNSADK
jgi:hypothetical protein